jgi:hypothetical protein
MFLVQKLDRWPQLSNGTEGLIKQGEWLLKLYLRDT